MNKEGKYYLYRHIRLDKYLPFYIGLGTKRKCVKKFDGKWAFHRAHEKNGRSNIWNNIFNKSNKKYKVEILFISDDYSFIKKKETEFVKLYGRVNNNTGILANLTDGGEGCHGLVHSDETLKKLRMNSIIMHHPKEIINEIISNSVSEIDKINNILAYHDNIVKEREELKLIPKIRKPHSEQTKEKLREKALNRSRQIRLKIAAGRKKKIYNSNTNETYNSLKHCCEILKLHKSEVCRNLTNKTIKNKYPHLKYIS